jgi:hydroxymethylpyrimidine/phosphomethylpyrimidine kinase
VDVLSPEAVKTQLETVLELFPVRFAKTGMLANEKIIACTAFLAEKYDLQLIVDPVMVSTSGARLLEESAVSAMRELLFPRASWITPNIPEAELLCGKKISTPADLAEAAVELHEKFKCNVILKSGHFSSGDRVADIVCCEGKLYSLSSPVAVIRGNSSHGTGCTLSAAIAALLAAGKSWQESLTEAKAFVYGSLVESRPLNGTLFQMYPPEKQYLEQVTLEEL